MVTFGLSFMYSAMTSRGTTPWFAPTYTKKESFTGPSAPAGFPPLAAPPLGAGPAGPHAAKNASAVTDEMPSAAERPRNRRRVRPRRYSVASLSSSFTEIPPLRAGAVVDLSADLLRARPRPGPRHPARDDNRVVDSQPTTASKMPRMRFTVVGAGAIGGITGTHLIAAGHDVTFVDTDQEHIAAIRERGLTLEGVSSLTVRPKAAIHPAELRALRDALSAVQECEASENVLGCVWSKIAMASVFFATALVDADVKDILARERYHDLMADLVAESVAAADAMSVQLIELHGFDPESLRPERRSAAGVRRALEAIAGSFNPLQQRTGIWIDLAVRKRKTEAEPQLGRLLGEAARRGMAMPLNRAVLELITEMETGRRGFAWENLDEVERRRGAARAARG